jgi:hypothetical protein
MQQRPNTVVYMPVPNNDVDLLSRDKNRDHPWPSVRPHEVLQNVMFRRAAPRPRPNCPSRARRYCRRIERELALLGDIVQAINDTVQYKKKRLQCHSSNTHAES